MYIILWEFQVKADTRAKFVSAYASNGTWAELFKKSPNYLGTELLHDENDSSRYLTIDRWVSKGTYEASRSQWKADYAQLDEACTELTERESLLGVWESVS